MALGAYTPTQDTNILINSRTQNDFKEPGACRPQVGAHLV